ncbi:MAG: filamentous hemagglutinin N-terminal domain-containing protein [Nitrospira sp.]|nr:filamentous hemagglutinin N-terminal domain-containing protein [Nitrospira sp.]
MFTRLTHSLGSIILLLIGLGVPVSVPAQSTSAIDPVVQLGSGTVAGLGTSQITVDQTTQLMGIQWDSLGNNVGEVLQFNQPSASAVALNRVVGADPSQFLGSVFANGSVIVINPNGVFFGPHSQVNVNGLIASSLNITDADFMNGRHAFQGAATNGAVQNEGQISAGPFGVYLLAPNVTNNGVIRSPNGHIALAAGTTAYLSNRADGRGFLVEVNAPAGESRNLKDLIADGGQVSMIGRLVTQSGLVQANTVRQQNGKIHLVATDRVALTAGSVTSAKGGAQGVSDGGAILVKSDLTAGHTKFEQGAVLDSSGGVGGGNGGFVEVSGSSVALGGRFVATAVQGYRGGRFLIDPTVGTQTVTTADLQGFTGSGASDVEFRSPPGTNLTVSINPAFSLAPVVDPTTGTVLSGWALPPGQEGFLRFTAGNDLIFSPNVGISNGQVSGPSAGSSAAKWSYVLTAGNDILFDSTRLFAGGGGNISLNAIRDIKLVPDTGGGHTILQTFSGDISIVAGRDLIAPSAFQGQTPSPTNSYSGIRLDGTGNLTITTGEDFLGGIVNGLPTGPGFVLSDGKARINLGGNLGAPDNYANFTIGTQITDSSTNTSRLGLATVSVTAQNNIYFGLMQDRGLVDRVPGQPGAVLVTANPNSSVNLLSHQGNMYLQPPAPGFGFGDIRRNVYPASFSASAPNGDIFIQRLLEFWPSPVGTILFFAGRSIVGTANQADPAGISLCRFTCGTEVNPIAHVPRSITLSAAGGDISDLKLDLVNSYRKIVTISAGRDIRNIFGAMAAPDFGNDAMGHPIPAVKIAAKRDIDLSGRDALDSGFIFGGTGLVKLTAGGTVDLAASRGITFRLDPEQVTSDADKGGLLDIGVGGDVKMTQSRIISNNGASLFIHGLDAAAPGAGNIATATSAILGVVTVNGRQVLAVAGNPVLGHDGITAIPVDASNTDLVGRIGSPVYLAGGKPVLDAGGLPVVVGPNDAVLGRTVLVVNGTAALGINGKPIVVDAAASSVVAAGDLVQGVVVLDRPLVQLADGAVMLVTNGKTVFSAPPGNGAIDGRPNVVNGTLTLLVNGKQVDIVEPVGGSVNIGTNRNSVTDQTGIVTVRGGAIDLKAAGNIDVNLSRIATLGGRDITLTSTAGDINAGSGARTDVTLFPIEEIAPDGTLIKTFFSVPGSGIFTFSPKDGNLPDIPPFNPISPFEATVFLHQFLGHDVSQLEPLAPAAHEAWLNQYKQSTEQLFAGFKLGDIRLTAAHDVIVPPAGIRGRNVTINAGHNLDLQGGLIRGITDVNVGGQLVGSLTSFVGVFVVNLGGISGGAGGTTLGLGSISDSVGSVTTSSSVTAAASTVSMTTQKVDDVATPKVIARASDKQAGHGTKTASLRIRDKVRVKVETKAEEPGE